MSGFIPQMREGGAVLASALTPAECRQFLKCLDKLSIRAREMLEEAGTDS